MIFFAIFLSIFHDLMQLLQRIESIYHRLSLDLWSLFCPTRRIYIWFPTLQIYVMTFVAQKINTIKDEISTSLWYFQLNLISIKKWFKRFFDNFICFIITVCKFQSMKTTMELNSLSSKFFCCITCFVLSPD